MAPMSANNATNSSVVMREVLQLIAHTPALDRTAPHLLQRAQQVGHADAAFFMIFAEPRTVFTAGIAADQLPDDDALRAVTTPQSHDLHLRTTLPPPLTADFAAWGIVTITQHDDAVGMVALLYREEMTLDESSDALLMAIVDGLSIVTRQARASARHEKLMRNQNEFVSIVSHDLRTPLTSMKGFGSMLESQMAGDLNDEQAHFVNKMLSGITQMTSLVDNIQDAGRYDPETGFYEMQRQPSDITDIVRSIVDTHLLPAEKQDLDLRFSTSDDIPIVNIDDRMIERAVINLVDNAIKYTPNGRQVEVKVQRVNDALEITVTDNGYGISEENRKYLFQRHYRVQRREHKLVKGSGLGLFIVRSVARQHGGDAFVHSIEGEGSTFGIRIPLTGENLIGSSAGASLGDAT